ncbi:MAG TPA: dTMP kinase [Ktedonobacteraceae bacterium]|nr:dTMP kinase [Ktedonobacteraceae bacterium]
MDKDTSLQPDDSKGSRESGISGRNQGFLISFEGLDGAGKTTQIRLLGRWLEEHAVSYVLTREPGGTALGAEIRKLLFHHPELAITPLAEAFLFQADRAQHFATLIVPALEAGITVITDRCFDSSIVYQGAVRGVGVEVCEQLSLLATGGRIPDLTILLDLNPEFVEERTQVAEHQSGLRESQSRFDREALAFHQQLREAFLALARTHPQRIKVIEASQSQEQIHQQIVALVERLLQ